MVGLNGSYGCVGVMGAWWNNNCTEQKLPTYSKNVLHFIMFPREGTGLHVDSWLSMYHYAKKAGADDPSL